MAETLIKDPMIAKAADAASGGPRADGAGVGDYTGQSGNGTGEGGGGGGNIVEAHAGSQEKRQGGQEMRRGGQDGLLGGQDVVVLGSRGGKNTLRLAPFPTPATPGAEQGGSTQPARAGADSLSRPVPVRRAFRPR